MTYVRVFQVLCQDDKPWTEYAVLALLAIVT
jgi:hypothetical protein